MRTIGQIIKEARNAKKYSLVRLENSTRIKMEFIEAIEDERWKDLPPFATVLGFVKSLSSELDLDEKNTLAFLRRDYPPRKAPINPKPDISGKFFWNPRTTFMIGVGLIGVLIFGYLIFQYLRFSSPPNLVVESPVEGQKVSGGIVVVFGKTDVDSVVSINGQPVLVDADGKFNANLEITAETGEILIRSVSRSGKESTIRRTIEVEK